MKIITTKGVSLNVTEFTEIQYIGPKKINRGCIRWLVAALVFLPLVLLYFFMGDTVHEFKINGEYHLLDEYNYVRISKI
jgi:hypothetical protein